MLFHLMDTLLNLAPDRGTKLLVTGDEATSIQLAFGSAPNPGEKFPWNRILFLLHERIDWLLNLHPEFGVQQIVSVEIPPHTPFMIMNLTQNSIFITGDEKLSERFSLFNPYLYEHQAHESYDPNSFLDRFQIPPGYTDTLAKWYSIKYSYENHNLILIRPGTGLSFQTHSKRAEHWEILQGNPKIVIGTEVFYTNPPGTERDLPLGALHNIINASLSEWVIFKETYQGTFDEEDIVRVFNPNHYFTP